MRGSNIDLQNEIAFLLSWLAWSHDLCRSRYLPPRSGEHPRDNINQIKGETGMGIKKFKQLLGATISSLGLVAGLSGGMVSAQGAAIDTTGPDSTNTITYTDTATVVVDNSNTVSGSNENDQSSTSGRAEVEHNTSGGSARSGAASNKTSFGARVSINNAASDSSDMGGAGNNKNISSRITETGPDSTNEIAIDNTRDVVITNTNDLSITNTNTQTARSGSAEVEDNTTGGSATTGNATNTSSEALTFTISN